MNGGSGAGLEFAIEIDATRDLAVDADRVEALITIGASHAGMALAPAQTIEVLIMDRSRSMMSQNKIHEARRAACAAIDALPDGTLLAVVAGNQAAQRIFPAVGKLAKVDAAARATAKRQVMRLRPEGGTKIGRWLVAASDLFAAESASGVIRHAVLYSDGKNQHEVRAELDTALSACADRFVCDVRGLGDDWDYTELLHIAEMLHGDATAVLRIADLADDFTRLIEAVQRLVVPRVYLRLRPDDRFRIHAIAQTHPVQVDLTGRQQPAGGTAVDVPLGAWAPATRCYHLSLRIDPAVLPIGDEVRATPVEVLTEAAGGARERRAHAALVVRRHATPGFETEIPLSLTEVAKEREVAFAMRACADAWLHGQAAEADDELNQAMRLARELDDPRLPLLEAIADIGSDGKARLRTGVTHGNMQQLGLDSTKTAIRRPDLAVRAGPGPGTPPVSVRPCPTCGETTSADDLKYCENCGKPFESPAS